MKAGVREKSYKSWGLSGRREDISVAGSEVGSRGWASCGGVSALAGVCRRPPCLGQAFTLGGLAGSCCSVSSER